MRDHSRNPQAAAAAQPVFERFRVTVMSIDTSMVGEPHQDPRGVAITMDDFRRQRKIGVSTINGSGVYPQVGEVWVIDRSLGTWTFATKLDASTPAVTGSRASGAALASLLKVLSDLGIIEDQTTP